MDISKLKRYANRPLIDFLIMVLALTAATLLSMLLRATGFSENNIVVIYILSVLMVARYTKGYICGITASVVGMFCFNFFFTEPYHTFNVNNKSYIATFAVMLIASILTSTLTSKILHSSKEAKLHEKQANMLYQITSSLAKASSVSDVATVSVQSLSNLLDCDVCCLTADSNGQFSKKYSIKQGERSVHVCDLTSGEEKSIIQSNNILPIADQSHQYGLICLPKSCISEEDNQEKLLSSISTQIFVAMERERLSDEKEMAKDEAEREKFKSDLLRSISHDLRTPLAGISGAAEMLLYSLKEEETRNLAQGIYNDSNWLTQMVENILSLTKIQEGKLLVKKRSEAVEEIVGEAVDRASKYADEHTIEVEIPDKVLFVPMDGKLIEQVLINLIDNAVKHTSSDGHIKVAVKPEVDKVWFYVTDDGTGMNPDDLPKIFNLFYKADGLQSDSNRGIGLGLAICKAIVNAHGGKIYANNNKDGGAEIRFYLPLEGGTHFGK